MLGQFSILIGIWKLTDIDLLGILVDDTTVLSYVPFLSLYLALIPFSLYIRSMFDDWKRVWDIPCAGTFVALIVSVALQVAGIADMRETFWLCHFVMLLITVIAVVMLVREFKQGKWSYRLSRMILCLGVCLGGMLADLVNYYLSDGTAITAWSMFGFLFYIIVLGVVSIRQAKQLIAIGRMAQKFEEMAYHDQMTGLYNRAAFTEMLTGEDFQKEGCILVAIDLNNLKKCNDTYGHEKGDLYISSSAKIIEEAFGDIGKCFRMGGDEFSVLIQKHEIDDCRERTVRMQNMVVDWNKEHTEPFSMQIACGYAQYEPSTDYDMGDTARRADKLMYQQKFYMKQTAKI